MPERTPKQEALDRLDLGQVASEIGQITRGEAHGLAVEVDATGPAVIVRLSAAPPGPLQLVLRSPNLTRRLTMAGTTLTLPPPATGSGWRWSEGGGGRSGPA